MSQVHKNTSEVKSGEVLEPDFVDVLLMRYVCGVGFFFAFNQFLIGRNL